MSEPNPVDELAGHFLKIFVVGMVAFMVIAIVTSAGEGPTRQLIYWSLMGLFVACGSLLGLLGAYQLSRQFAGEVPERASAEVAPRAASTGEPVVPRHEESAVPARRPPSTRSRLAGRSPNSRGIGETDAI